MDGVTYEDWFAGDFTVAEIKTLRAIQPMPQRPHEYDGKFHIPTFEEIIALAKAKSIEKGRTIGIYPETKHPSFHEKTLKLPLTEKVLEALKKAG